MGTGYRAPTEPAFAEMGTDFCVPDEAWRNFSRTFAGDAAVCPHFALSAP